MWTQFRNDGNVPTQYAANTGKQSNSKACLGVLPRFLLGTGRMPHPVGGAMGVTCTLP